MEGDEFADYPHRFGISSLGDRKRVRMAIHDGGELRRERRLRGYEETMNLTDFVRPGR